MRLRVQSIVAFALMMAVAVPPPAVARLQEKSAPAEQSAGREGKQQGPNESKPVVGVWRAIPGEAKPQRAMVTDMPRARQAMQLGLLREQAGEWETAFEAYSEAVAASQGTLPESVARREMARSRVTARRIEHAESAAVAGRFRDAADLLRAVLEMDPTNGVARERLEQLWPHVAGERAVEEQAGRDASAEEVKLRAAPLQVKPRAGTHTFRVREQDQRVAYEEIARVFGLRVLFDEDVQTKQIRFDAEAVDFLTAMSALGHLTNTFWIAIDERTFLVAPDTQQKRRELEPQVTKTILLDNAARPEELAEMARLVREIVGSTRVTLDTRSRTLTIRDTVDAVALATKLVGELERARGEMMLEIEVLEVDRETSRLLGITPPSTAQVFAVSPSDVRDIQNAQTPEELLRVLRRIFGLPTSFAGGIAAGASLASLLPPLIAFGGGNTTLLATLPGAAADFSMAFRGVRSARRILMRSGDAQPATFFVGDRFPVTLATLEPSFLSGQAPIQGDGTLRRNDIAAGEGPSAVVTRDFDGDGVLDLAVTNEVADTFSIFLGEGDGRFTLLGDTPTGRRPVALAAADFNGDANLDLAIVNNGEGTDDGSISIFLGDGTGAFALSGTLTAGIRPIAGAVFTSSGQTDLAVANFDSNTISIFTGNGDGTFAAPTELTTGAGPRALATADFDGDGFVDVAVVNETANTLQTFRGNGAGGFGTPSERNTGNAPRGIATGDLDGVLRADIVVANSGDDSVSAFLNFGNGNFGPRLDFSVGAEPTAVILADFTRDGVLDLVTANAGANTITLLLGARETFQLRADLDVGDAPVAIDSGDFSGDNLPDVVTANRDGDSLTVILNSSSFVPITPNLATPYPGSTYEDIGLKVKATPRLHPNREVTLQLDMELRNLAGTALNGVPVITNRKMEQTIRLKEDETTILSGILQNDESLGFSGWPILAGIPAAGHAFGARSTGRRQMELIITITPRRVRLADRVDRSFYAGRGESGTSGGMVGGGARRQTADPPRQAPATRLPRP